MKVLGIDPGPEESAYCVYDTETQLPGVRGKRVNHELLRDLGYLDADTLAVEMVASYGMAVGAEVFDTCFIAGRVAQRWVDATSADWLRVFRRDVKLHLCGDSRAKDSNIRQALIDRFGPGKDRAIGRKASPGPLYGMAGDVWAALGVAITAAETRP